MSRKVRDLIRSAAPGSATATEEQLIAAGLSSARIRRLVADGTLRRGVCGYWLPGAPDKGALAVMQAAIRGDFAEEE